MDLEDKARATLQELLDVVKGYREAAERSDHEASRMRLQCEAWRSRALEEQRRSARLRRMLSNGVHVISKSHLPSLQHSPKQGLLNAFSEEEILYQFGSLLALVITLSGPAAASTPKAGSSAPGPFSAEPCPSGYPTKSTAAAAAAAAAALTAFAAGPQPPGRQEPTAASGAPTAAGGSDSGLLTAAQGRLHGNRAKSQGEIGVLSAAGSGGSAGYGGGGGGDLGQALSSSSSLSSLAAGSGNCVAAPGRSHSRAGFKLVVRGGNGDSTSLRQLTNYGAMYPAAATPGSTSTPSASCTATRVLPSRTSSRATGLGVIAPPHYHGGVHESYSACELTRAGGGEGGEAIGAGGGGGGGASSRQARAAAVRPTRAESVSGTGSLRDADGLLPLTAPGAASPSPSLEKGSPRRAVQGMAGERVAEPSGPGPSGAVVHAATSPIVRSKSQPPMLAETAHVAAAAISGSSSPDGGAMAKHGGGDASSSAANTAEAAAGAPPHVATPGGGLEQLGPAIPQDDGVEVGLRTSISEPGPQPDIEREAPGDDTSHIALPPAGPDTSRTLARGSAPGPFSGAAAPAPVASPNNDASPAAAAARSATVATHVTPELNPSSETPPTLRARSTAFNQDLRHAVWHTSVGPVARTQSATRGSGLGRTSFSLAPAATAPSTVPRRETVPAILQSSGRKSAANMSSPPAVHSDDLSWHAGSLHKQLVKLQDDLNSIQQSSALIRSNRATCNLAPSSPRHSSQPSPPPGSGAAGSAVPRRDTSVAPGSTTPPHQAGNPASPFSAAAVNAAAETARDSGVGGSNAGDNLSCLLPARAHSGPIIATSSSSTSYIPPSTASVLVTSIPIDDATIATAPSVDAIPPQLPALPSVSDSPSSPKLTSPPLPQPDPNASPPPAHRPPTAPECNTCSAMSPDPAFVALYWVKRPAAALVVAKPSPAVRPTFTRVLSWLHANGVSTYVEPSLLRNGFSLPLGGGATAAATANDGGWHILTDGETDGDGDAEGWSDAWADAEAAAAGPMPECATGFPRVLSWPAEEGNDCHSQMVPSDVAAAIDFVVVLGGDGTVLWTCHIFGNQSVPPVLPFNLGSLGFLTPFDPEAAEGALQHVMEGGFPIMLRHRLHCHIVRASQVHCTAGGTDRDAEGSKGASRVRQSSDEDGGGSSGGRGPSPEWVVLNEVVIDRGISSFLTNLECYCDGTFVTHVQGDGLIVATPTGSTAYNLAAGGSMVHPQVPGILFTPICPHSLSFRPLIFPDYVSLCIQVPANSRAQMWCSFDGKDRQALSAGDAVVIRMSAWPVPTVCSRDASRDWFSGVREGLHWNMRRLQAGAGQ